MQAKERKKMKKANWQSLHTTSHQKMKKPRVALPTSYGKAMA